MVCHVFPLIAIHFTVNTFALYINWWFSFFSSYLGYLEGCSEIGIVWLWLRLLCVKKKWKKIERQKSRLHVKRSIGNEKKILSYFWYLFWNEIKLNNLLACGEFKPMAQIRMLVTIEWILDVFAKTQDYDTHWLKLRRSNELPGFQSKTIG